MNQIIDSISKTLILLLVNSTFNYAQITIQVNLDSSNISTREDIFFAGNINNWNPKDQNFKLQPNEPGSYQITFTPPVGLIEYKFTKGSWTTVETSADGQDVPNRTLEYDGSPQTINITIQNWKGESKTSDKIKSTAAQNVSILQENFYISQLDRERKIWIYLPPDYESTDKSYPVLYMHDGQNLFDANTSFLGEWNVDESLNALYEKDKNGIIVVGIENGEGSRVNEYTPWTNPEYGGGDGDKYVRFMVETLKPYVDNNFRTKTDRLNTGIMGSSLGGLISFYAAIKYPEVFSKAGVLSPSFWFSDEVYAFAKKAEKNLDMKIYLLGGELESATLVDEISTMVATLQKAGFKESEIKMVTHEDGAHNEQYWSREFKDCYLWLFK